MKKFTFICMLSCLVSLSQISAAQSKATFYTTMGNFVVDLYDTLQPITTNNFKTLVNAKFYDGIIFHRVISGFMIQGGCPLGNGTGGPGYAINDEFDPATSNIQKTIAMANSGPNTGGSQFFINLVNNTYLNPNHPVFGMVSSNFTVVQNIGNVATNAADKPLTDVVMDSIRITAFPTATKDLQHQQHLLFEIFPNPANANSILSIQSEKAQTIDLSVSDIFGVIHYHQVKQIAAGVSKFPFSDLNTGGLAAGIYFIIVKNNNEVYTRKVLLHK